MRGRMAVCALALAFGTLLSGCAVLPQQTDAADEAILRVVTLSREEEELVIRAVTAGIQTGDSSEPPETVEGRGADYEEARTDLKREREASLNHATDWVVEEDVFYEALEAFIIDPELTYAAHIYLLRDQSAGEFLEAFESEETGPSRNLSDLDRALEDRAVTVLEVSARLAAGEECGIPVLKAEEGKAEVEDEVTVKGWK